VVGLYVPSRGPKEQRNVAKRTFQDAVAAALPDVRRRMGVGGPVVLTGDRDCCVVLGRAREIVNFGWSDCRGQFVEGGRDPTRGLVMSSVASSSCPRRMFWMNA